jgi:microcin C transport system substrate-binding protein
VPGTRHSSSLFDPFSSFTGGLFWLDKQMEAQTRQAMEDGVRLAPRTIVDETYKMAVLKEIRSPQP